MNDWTITGLVLGVPLLAYAAGMWWGGRRASRREAEASARWLASRRRGGETS